MACAIPKNTTETTDTKFNLDVLHYLWDLGFVLVQIGLPGCWLPGVDGLQPSALGSVPNARAERRLPLDEEVVKTIPIGVSLWLVQFVGMGTRPCDSEQVGKFFLKIDRPLVIGLPHSILSVVDNGSHGIVPRTQPNELAKSGDRG